MRAALFRSPNKNRGILGVISERSRFLMGHSLPQFNRCPNRFQPCRPSVRRVQWDRGDMFQLTPGPQLRRRTLNRRMGASTPLKLASSRAPLREYRHDEALAKQTSDTFGCSGARCPYSGALPRVIAHAVPLSEMPRLLSSPTGSAELRDPDASEDPFPQSFGSVEERQRRVRMSSHYVGSSARCPKHRFHNPLWSVEVRQRLWRAGRHIIGGTRLCYHRRYSVCKIGLVGRR